MRIDVGIENNVEGRTLAWALDFPGCFTYGTDAKDALMHLPCALLAYHERVRTRAEAPWLAELGDFDIRIVEVFNVYDIDDNYRRVESGSYSVNAWFQNDWLPLTAAETLQAGEMLHWSRADLLQSVEGLSDAQLDEKQPGERWPIRGILKHVATAEWWYLDRLDLAGGAEYRDLPEEDVFERLRVERAWLEESLPQLAGMNRVRGASGEFWSPRKLVRRALWHELDHVEHIYKLLL